MNLVRYISGKYTPSLISRINPQCLKRTFITETSSFITLIKPNLNARSVYGHMSRRITQTSRNKGQLKYASLFLLFPATKSFLFNSANCERIKSSHKSRVNTIQQQIFRKKEPRFNWSLFWDLIKPDIAFFIVATLAAFAVAVVNIKLPLLLGDLVNAITKLIKSHDEGPVNVFNELYQPCKKLVWNYTIQALLTFLYITSLSCFGERFAARMRIKLFRNLMEQDMAFFDQHKTGEVINRLTSDIQDFKSSFKQVVSQGLRSVTQIIGCAFTLYSLSPKLTSLMILVLPGVILVGTGLGSALRQISRRAQEQISLAMAVADEAVGNIRTVRAFAMENKEVSWYADEVKKSQFLNELLGAGIGAFQGLSNFAVNGIILLVLYTGAVLMDTQELKPGDMMSYLVATQTVQKSLGAISILFGQIVRGMSAGARVFEYMDYHASIPLTGGTEITADQLNGNIKFDNVKFSYPTRPDQLIIDELSLDIGSGKVVALCGSSGSGKSTLAALLERFYDVNQGSITVDGVELNTLNPAWLRGELIGYINQEPTLFATSVLENIRYGSLHATDQEVYEAAKQANADTFIRSFPEGYETVIGERGATVSGGQKQRIAIARALLKNPKILILDEATSALDAESERIVQNALDKLIVGRTVIIIAHRLSTIQNADLIAVMSHGKIAELGTHTELLQRNGLYAELIRRQTSDEL